MKTSLQFSLPVVFIMFCVLVVGNYLINRRQGVDTDDNLRETRMWGIGFIVYAILDYLVLMI